MAKEVVNKRVKVTENTTLANLGLMDQIKLLLHNFNNDEVEELKAQEEISRNQLKAKAELYRAITKATKAFEDNKHDKVLMEISQKYLTYVDEVTDKQYGLGRYYDFEIVKQDLPVEFGTKFLLTIKRRVT